MKKVLHRSFKPAKCKTALQMASSRLKILKNKKDVQIKQLRRELAQLLESGQDQTARIRVEHVVREEKTVAAYELVGIYCELLVARLAIIDSQKNCPTDLKEAVASVLFASQRFADVPELSDVAKHFTAKYGKDFASAAIELRPDCGVSRLLVEKLSVKAPDGPTKVRILTGIAEEHNVNWEPKSFGEPDPKAAEVLSGPSSFESASRIHVDSPRVPENKPSTGPAPPVIAVPHGSIERNNVPVNTYAHDGRSPSHAQNVAPPDAYLNKTSDSYHPYIGRSGPRTDGVEYRPPSHAQNVASADAYFNKTSDSYHPNVRRSAASIDGVKYGHPDSGDGNSSPMSQRKWEMEFVDATAAARAAAESAERASMAARAAAELSSKERLMRQNSTESQYSSPSYNFTHESAFRESGSNLQSQHFTEDHPSPRRNSRTQYEDLGVTRQGSTSGDLRKDGFQESYRSSWTDASVPSNGGQSEIAPWRGSRHSRESSSEMRQPSEPSINVGYSEEVQLRKQSSPASSRSHSRTCSDEHAFGSGFPKSPNVFEENVFAPEEEDQPQNSTKETNSHDDDHDDDGAPSDDYSSYFDKPQFDAEDVHDEPEYGLGFSLLGGKSSAHASTDANAWSFRDDHEKFLAKKSSSSQILQEQRPSPVFDDVPTSSTLPLHMQESSVKYDDYSQDSESEEEPSKSSKERLEPTSDPSPGFQVADEVAHDFFPSDTDEPMDNSRKSEESKVETQTGFRFGALTGGLRNKKMLPPYRISPARDAATSSKPEDEYTSTNVDRSSSSSAVTSSISSRRNRKQIYGDKVSSAGRKLSSTPPDPSSSDDDSEDELTRRGEHGKRSDTKASAPYFHSRIIDDDSEEELPKRAPIKAQEINNKQTGTKDHQGANVQAPASHLFSPSSDDEEEKVRRNASKANTRPNIMLSRRTKAQPKAPERSSFSVTVKDGEDDRRSRTKPRPESHAQQFFRPHSDSKRPMHEENSKPSGRQLPSGSSQLPEMETPSKETLSQENASHVHPKLPDYDNLLATFESLRSNRR